MCRWRAGVGVLLKRYVARACVLCRMYAGGRCVMDEHPYGDLVAESSHHQSLQVKTR